MTADLFNAESHTPRRHTQKNLFTHSVSNSILPTVRGGFAELSGINTIAFHLVTWLNDNLEECLVRINRMTESKAQLFYSDRTKVLIKVNQTFFW